MVSAYSPSSVVGPINSGAYSYQYTLVSIMSSQTLLLENFRACLILHIDQKNSIITFFLSIRSILSS